MNPTVDIFGLPLATYSLLLVAGIYLALASFVLLAPTRNIARPRAFLFAFLAIIGGLLGARFLFVFTQVDYLIEAIRHGESRIVWRLLLDGGFVFFGGLIGGALTGALAARVMKIPLIHLADLAAPSLALGQSIGRVGCHFAGCCYGIPSERCGLIFPEESQAPSGIELFPTQLTEAVFMLGLMLVLIFVYLRCRPGRTAPLYLICYGLFRFLLEFLRGDRIRGFVGPLSISQWIALATLALGLFLMARKNRPLVADGNDM